jgi:hypothetical protein
MREGNAPDGGWREQLLQIAAGFVVLAAVATIVVIGRERPPDTPANSPVAAVKAFVVAVNDGYWDTADSYLSSRLRASGVSMEVSNAQFYEFYLSDASLVRQTASSAVVAVSFSVKRAGGFEDVVARPVDMVRESGGWKIDAAFWISSAEPAK